MTREELWLAAIAGLEGAVPPDYPVWHYEQMLAAIYDAVTGAADPRPFPERSWHLDEVLYAVYCAVAGLDDPGCPEPTCRLEQFWVGILGQVNGETVTVPEPVWRIEEFLKGVFDAASDWGATMLTETGNAPITLTNAIAAAIHALTQYGLCTQASTPTPSAPVDIMCNNGALKWNGTAVVADGTPEVLTVGEQTATVEDLLAVGDYKDTHDIISGSIERNVGVILYDGSEDENWSRLGTNAFAVTNSKKIVGKYAMLCSHYTYTAATSARCSSGEFGCSSGTLRSVYFKNELYDTVDDWRAALAAEPIIVIYPLATPTTEQTTAQHLVTHKGTNVVDVTANVSPIALEVAYIGEAP